MKYFAFFCCVAARVNFIEIPNSFELSEHDLTHEDNDNGNEIFFKMCEIRESLEYGVCDEEFKSCEVELFAKESSFNISSCEQYITTTKPETTTAITETSTTAATTTPKHIPTTGVMPSPTGEADYLKSKDEKEKKINAKSKSGPSRKRRSAESTFPVIFTTLIKSELTPKLVVQTYNADLKELKNRQDVPYPLPDEIFNDKTGVDFEIDYKVIIEDYTTQNIDSVEIGFMSFFSVGGAILIALTISAFTSSISKGLLLTFGFLCFASISCATIFTMRGNRGLTPILENNDGIIILSSVGAGWIFISSLIIVLYGARPSKDSYSATPAPIKKSKKSKKNKVHAIEMNSYSSSYSSSSSSYDGGYISNGRPQNPYDIRTIKAKRV